MISEAAGYEKPDQRIYIEALRDAGCKPEEAIMVGDNTEKDLVGAKNVGMKTVWVKKNRGIGKADYKIKNLRELPKVVEKMK